MRSDKNYLEHILDCIKRIEEDTNLGKTAFLASHIQQDAVLRNLQILTESSQRLSDDQKRNHSEVEWAKMAAFRNILVHDYLGIDLEQVWLIIQRDIPVLKSAITDMLHIGDTRKHE